MSINAPWKFEKYSGTVRDRANHCIMSNKTFANGGTFDAANIENWESIANLIAVAPELLDKLKELRDYFKNENETQFLDRDLGEEIQELIDKAEERD